MNDVVRDGNNKSSADDKRGENFNYNYSAIGSDEKRWIENIRRQYLPDERSDKVAEIKSLHKKAKTVPCCIAIAIGIIGTLVLGIGMTLALQWDSLIAGIIVGIVGMGVMLITYPLYQWMRDHGKRKYGDRIIKLADELSVDIPDEHEKAIIDETDE